MRHTLILAAPLLLVAACAHAPQTASPVPPDFSPVATSDAPRARLYADCIAQSATVGSYGRAHDPDTELVLFTCTGAPARAFYDGLADWSARVGSEAVNGGRTFRSTNPVRRDLFGVDYCSTDGAGDYRCVITLNAGAFLTP